jgi:hypothetical protein
MLKSLLLLCQRPETLMTLTSRVFLLLCSCSFLAFRRVRSSFETLFLLGRDSDIALVDWGLEGRALALSCRFLALSLWRGFCFLFLFEEVVEVIFLLCR